MWSHKDRVYYNFSEIIQGCGISKTGLDNCILNGTVAVHVWIPPVSVFKLTEQVVGSQVLLNKEESHWQGYTAIFAADYRKILSRGRAYLREFPGREMGETISMRCGADDLEVAYDDLVILAEGKAQLEEHLGLRANGETVVEVIGKAMGPQMPRAAVTDPAFRHIKYKGRDYQMGTVQAAVVKRLYEAAKDGDPWQSGKRILQDVGSETFAIKDVFTRQPFWRELIMSDNRGMYRLHEDFVAGLVIKV